MPEPPEHGQNAGPEPPELLPEPPGLPGNVLEPPRNRPGTLIGWDQNSILLLGKKNQSQSLWNVYPYMYQRKMVDE